MQTQNTLPTLLNYHWCLSSDTFDYKSDRIIFALECPLIFPEVCHIVMGRSGKGLAPGSRYTQRLREAERASGGLSLNPVVPEACSISAHCTAECHERRNPTSSHAGSSQFTVPYHKGPDKYQEEVSFCAGWGGIRHHCPMCLSIPPARAWSVRRCVHPIC